jgi:hypothetical protein
MVKISVTEESSYSMEGDFEFHMSPLILNEETLEPFKKISFDWSPELPQDLQAMANVSHEELSEMIGEKLKHDFKKAMLNNSFIDDPAFKVKKVGEQ